MAYARTSIERNRFAGSLRLVFQHVDALIVPVYNFQSPTWSELEQILDTDVLRLCRFTMPFNASGSPSVTFPVGFSEVDRPVA
ncbi:amidase family protein [Mesorhizobium sp. CO1-1-8]|uniref:amidase family protein n=1 Tax=Mesorhizobium sp. CO1-1-8 TaxID=2876631 RepID=UPI001CD16CDB|nr:amidase [Mesorhizobium sp. CO1-1-8]